MKIKLPLLVLVSLAMVCSCGDFSDFDNRRNGSDDRSKDNNPKRRIILNPSGPSPDSGVGGGEDGALPHSSDSGTAPAPDTTLPPKPDSGPPSTTCGSAFEDEVFRKVNQERAKGGLPPYHCHVKAGIVARNYSTLMCNTGHFSHTGPDGSSPWQRLKAGGVSYQTAGENIAAGQSSPTSVMSSWMKSPGHRGNIMSTKFTHIGVGYAFCGNGYKHYWTQAFIK